MRKLKPADKAARVVTAKVAKTSRSKAVSQATGRVKARTQINFRAAVRK
jgi:hypothetical protein